MSFINIEPLVGNTETVESYLSFKLIEEWCESKMKRGRWRFDYSTNVCAYGVDIPGRIFFWHKEDLDAFANKFMST